ncbi:MAG: pseudouridine synthase, partial [Acidobacteriota bacterium]
MAAPAIEGILIIDKPVDWTSHDVVAKMRGILKTRRIGHTGTLDPFATGVLVVCVNRATRLVQFLTGHDKEYLATIRLGWRTDSGDLTGQPLGEPADALMINHQMINAVLDKFKGQIYQTPPMF